MGWLLAMVAAVIAAGLFFPWASRRTKKMHARFGPKDVESALVEIVTPSRHDGWDLFLAWPIDDPYLESIRQQCIEIAAQHSGLPHEDITEEGVRRVTALLQQLRARTREFAQVIVQLLRGVASGEVASEEAMRVLMSREKELAGHKLLAGAWPLVQHFGDDLDIRSKEPDYDLRRRAEMEQLADEIEQKYGSND